MTFHELKVAPRALNRAMRRAIQGDYLKAIVELILNADDSYRRLEDANIEVSGVIEIDFERERGSAHFDVRDFAEGMSAGDAIAKTTDWGNAHSGHAGGSARGFFGRGGKDALFEMPNGCLVTIRDSVVSELRFVEKGGRRGVEQTVAQAKPGRRQLIGILSGNGTVASFDLAEGTRIPQLETVREALSTLYPIRKVLANPNRDLILKHRGEAYKLRYERPVGEVLEHGVLAVPTDAGDLVISYEVFTAPQELDQLPSERREGGLLITDSKDSVIDLSLFRFDRDPDAERLFGEVRVDGLREAMQHDETLVTEERDGLNLQNKSARQLASAIEAVLDPIVRKQRESTRRRESEQSSKTRRKVDDLTHALNELATKITGEKSGPSAGGSQGVNPGGRVTPAADAPINPDPIVAIPASLTLTPRASSRVSIYFDTTRCKGDVIIEVDGSDEIEFSPDQFVIDDSKPIFRHDIEVFGLVAGVVGGLQVVSDSGDCEIPYRVVAEVYPQPANGIAFVPELVTASPGRGRTLQLYLDSTVFGEYGDVIFSIDDESVAHLDRTSVHYDGRDALSGIVRLGVKVTGVKVGASAIVRASCGDRIAECTFAVVSRRTPKPSAGGFFSGLDWDNNRFPKCTFRQDDAKMVIHCMEPTLRLLAVSAFTFDRDRAVQVAVAEACTQAACQRIAEATIPGQGKRRAYLHPGDDKKRLEEDYAFIQDLTKEVGPVVYRALVEDLPPVSSEALLRSDRGNVEPVNTVA